MPGLGFAKKNLLKLKTENSTGFAQSLAKKFVEAWRVLDPDNFGRLTLRGKKASMLKLAKDVSQKY